MMLLRIGFGIITIVGPKRCAPPHNVTILVCTNNIPAVWNERARWDDSKCYFVVGVCLSY